MKKIFLFSLTLILCLNGYLQSTPILIIDGKSIKFESDISLPYWLDAGRTIDLGSNCISASILEFNTDSNSLIYNRTIHLTGPSNVPNGKTWKIEAIGVGAKDSSQYITGFSNNSSPSIFTSPIYITNVGQNNWTVPPNITSICVEVWGGGGNGDLIQGGSGGGYGYQCFQVTPGTNYTLTVGGSGGTTTFDTLLTATGGSDGNATIQQGGSSTAFYSITGTVANSIDGASGANGGAGGRGMYYDCSSGNCVWRPAKSGNIPGGGGGGYRSGYSNTGLGARGQINIYF